MKKYIMLLLMILLLIPINAMAISQEPESPQIKQIEVDGFVGAFVPEDIFREIMEDAKFGDYVREKFPELEEENEGLRDANEALQKKVKFFSTVVQYESMFLVGTAGVLLGLLVFK